MGVERAFINIWKITSFYLFQAGSSFLSTNVIVTGVNFLRPKKALVDH